MRRPAALDLLRRMSGAIGGAAVSAAAAALLTPQVRQRLKVPSWLLWLTASIAAAITREAVSVRAMAPW